MDLKRMLVTGVIGGRSRPMITNGSFEANTAGWSAGNATGTIVAGGQVGNCLRITNTAAATGRFSQKVSAPNGTYTLTVYHKNGSQAGYISTSTAEGGFDGSVGEMVNDGAWTKHIYSLTVTADFWLNLFVNDTTIGHTSDYDEISMVKT